MNKKPMRIAVDLNEVVRDYLGQFLEYYQKYVNPSSTLKREDITNFKFNEAFDFKNYEEYEQFRYVDYVYELSCRADVVTPQLAARFNDWCTKTMRDFDEEQIPEIIIVSTFEDHLSIQSTYAFLASIGCRVRETYFPTDSSTIWNKCDLLITANPNLIANVPEGKTVVKIEAPYNKHVDAEIKFDKFIDLIKDETNTIPNMVENWGE